MYSYLFLFISSFVFLIPDKEKLNQNILYSLLFTSFSLSHASLGFISLILIFTGFSKFPIIIISLSIFLVSVITSKDFIQKLSFIKKFLILEKNLILKKYKNNIFQNSVFALSITLLVLILISSIGPINHPDASDYHVGYPFQYFLRGGFFIDGGLQQGLLGTADYANLAFIQERNIWLIRFIQVISLPLVILYFLRHLKNNIFLLLFLSVPTFIQWSTIGKPFFLGESSLIIVYIIWRNMQTQFSLKLLLITIINCIGFKISSLLIIFPIVMDVFFYITKKYKSSNLIKEYLIRLICSKEIFYSTLILISLLLNRFAITGNFAYPLLINIFNKNDELIVNFSRFLSSYERGQLFFLRIFIPTKISELGTSLGPCIFVILSTIFYINIKSFPLKNNNLFYVTIGQLVLLILFCQGRADYYVSPLILLIYQTNQIDKLFLFSKFKVIFYTSLIFQLVIINFFIIFSLFINIISTIDYSANMKNYAYGFNLSRLIDSSLAGNFLIEDRNVRFYYPEKYIDKDTIQRCINKNALLNENERRFKCLDLYNVKQIITTSEVGIEKPFNCMTINTFRASRNIFNRIKSKINYCYIN